MIRFALVFLLPIISIIACSKEKTEDYYFRFSLDGNTYSGVPAITVSGNNFALLYADGSMNFSISGLNLFTGVGEYSIGTGNNKYSSSLLISQSGLPTSYLGSSGVLKITEVTDTYIRGEFSTQLANVNMPSMTKQISNGEFYALIN